MTDPPAPLTVRPARRTDAVAVAAVTVAAWRQAYAGLLAPDYLASLSVDERSVHWDGVLGGTGRQRFLVVESGAGVAGYAHAGPSTDADTEPSTGALYSLYLDPVLWGAGAGRLLHDAALAALGEDGYRSATLWVLGTNQRARRFYRRQGWSMVSGTRTQEFPGHTVVDFRYGHRLDR